MLTAGRTETGQGDSFNRAKEKVRQVMAEIRASAPKRRFDPNKASYSEIRNGEILDGRQVDRIFLVLRGKGCEHALKHNGCIMCGFYVGQDGTERTPEQYVAQLRSELAKYEFGGCPVLCLYNNGSFFNDNELQPEVRRALLNEIAARKFRKLVVETRADSITKEKVSEAKRILGDTVLEIAVGLETSDDGLRDLCINKGADSTEYVKAAGIIHSAGARLRTYLLVKPPFLTEKESIEDTVRSVFYANDVLKADSIHLEVCTIQENTIISYLYEKHRYRPAWLWSIIEILERTAPLQIYVTPFSYVASIIDRPHNCEVCNKKVAAAILERYNVTYDRSVFQELDCRCKADWQKEIGTPPAVLSLPERIIQALGGDR